MFVYCVHISVQHSSIAEQNIWYLCSHTDLQLHVKQCINALLNAINIWVTHGNVYTTWKMIEQRSHIKCSITLGCPICNTCTGFRLWYSVPWSSVLTTSPPSKHPNCKPPTRILNNLFCTCPWFFVLACRGILVGGINCRVENVDTQN